MKTKDNSKVIAAVAIVLCFIVVPILGGIFFGSRSSTHTQPYWEKDLSPELVDKVEACHKEGMRAGRLVKGWDVVDIKCYEE